MSDQERTVLDLCGLKCPLPALMARRALLHAGPGALIEVVADDPLADLDIPHMCAEEGFEVLSLPRQGQISRFVLRRPAAWSAALPDQDD